MTPIVKPSPLHHENAVDITDIDLLANEHTPSTINFAKGDPLPDSTMRNPEKSQLDVVDELFGPYKIGNFLVTRSALDALGATIGGEPLNGQKTNSHNFSAF